MRLQCTSTLLLQLQRHLLRSEGCACNYYFTELLNFCLSFILEGSFAVTIIIQIKFLAWCPFFEVLFLTHLCTPHTQVLAVTTSTSLSQPPARYQTNIVMKRFYSNIIIYINTNKIISSLWTDLRFSPWSNITHSQAINKQHSCQGIFKGYATLAK
jgi:hypothetical protein